MRNFAAFLVALRLVAAHGDHGKGPAEGEAMQDYALRHVCGFSQASQCNLLIQFLLTDGDRASHVNRLLEKLSTASDYLCL